MKLMNILLGVAIAALCALLVLGVLSLIAPKTKTVTFDTLNAEANHYGYVLGERQIGNQTQVFYIGLHGYPDPTQFWPVLRTDLPEGKEYTLRVDDFHDMEHWLIEHALNFKHTPV